MEGKQTGTGKGLHVMFKSPADSSRPLIPSKRFSRMVLQNTNWFHILYWWLAPGVIMSKQIGRVLLKTHHSRTRHVLNLG